MSFATTVLVVDDDPTIRLVCRLNLELDGFHVLEAGNLTDARAAIETGTPDVLLLDVRVGIEDGIAFLHELKRAQPDFPVALVTGSARGDELLGAGADAVITKPFELEQLRVTVEELTRADR